jgi:hypothetical protein
VVHAVFPGHVQQVFGHAEDVVVADLGHIIEGKVEKQVTAGSCPGPPRQAGILPFW